MQNEDEIRVKKRQKLAGEFANEQSEKVAENLSDQCPSDMVIHLDTGVDIQPFFQVSDANEAPHDLVGSYHTNFERRKLDWIFPAAESDFVKIFNGLPRKKRKEFDKFDNFHIGRLCLFHEVVQVALGAVNRYKAKGAGLNIITGEDLLRSVGRLSMMITSADFLSLDESVIPLNMTADTYLIKRLRRAYKYRGGEEDLKRKVDRIRSNIDKAAPGLLTTGAYEHPATLSDREKLSNSLMAAFPFFINMLADFDAETIKSLALVNKTFLVLVGFAPPSFLFNDPERKQLIAGLAVSAAKLIKNSETGFPGDLSGNMGYLGFLPMLGSGAAKANALLQLKDVASKISDKRAEVGSDKYCMYLPWGGNQVVTLINEGSTRLIFSQALTILRMVTGSDTGKVDLTYEDIVAYLKTQDEDQIATKIKDAFLNLNNVNSPFIGELAILLVGVEGSQNNLAVLHAPMVTDLVCCNSISWNQAFYLGPNKIPYFAMAAHKGAKGDKPMAKHSDIIEAFNMRKYYDNPRNDYKFYDFLGGELDLHHRFLRTFWPELDDYEFYDQLIMSALIIKHYLLNTFFTDLHGEAAQEVNTMVNDFLYKRFCH
jgi:hypothetical protein